jgi:hypothetical protein
MEYKISSAHASGVKFYGFSVNVALHGCVVPIFRTAIEDVLNTKPPVRSIFGFN